MEEQFKPYPLAPRVMVGNMGTIIRPDGTPTKGTDHNLGYKQIGIMIDGKCKLMKVHRVIAITWLDNPNNLPEVHHIDNNRSNNELSNLRWVTKSENHIEAYKLGKKPSVGMLGRKQTDSAKQKMREAKLGRKREGYRGKWI
jgi:hypothetical protein